MDAQAAAKYLRKCFGRFPTGVTVVTYRSPDGVRGATMNSFTSVSLDPPLVLVSVARSSRTCAAIETEPFAVNILGVSQMDVALHFAGRPHKELQINWDGDDDPVTVPTLADAVAVFSCKPWQAYDGGDHVLIIGEVVSSVIREGEPLAFSDGRFTSLGLPMMDGPLVYALDGPPVAAWVGAAHRVQRIGEQC